MFKDREVPHIRYRQRKNINHINNYEKMWYKFIKKHEYDYEVWEVGKICNDLWAHISDTFVEAEHGILLDGLGYFVMASFKKQDYFRFFNKIELLHEGTMIYEPFFFPSVFKDTTFRPFKCRLIKTTGKRARAEIKKGKKYKCHFKFIKHLNRFNKKYFYDSALRKKKK